MKKIIPFLLIILVGIFVGCRYEEPGGSLKSPENRLIGYWFLQAVYKNDVQMDSVKDVLANQPGNYYSFHFDGPFAVTALIDQTIEESVRGDWKFENKKKSLNLVFVLHSVYYNYTADIIKLSGQELKYRYRDERGNTWRLHFYKR